MKRLLCFVMALAMTVSCTAALAWDSSSTSISDTAAIAGEITYLEGMLDASAEGTDTAVAVGSLFEHFRNFTITVNKLPYQTTQFFADDSSADEVNLAIRSYMGLPEELEVTVLDAPLTRIVTAAQLNCHETASSSSTLLGSFATGESVTVSALSGDWCKATNGTVSGWIMRKYLAEPSMDDEVPTVTAAYSDDDLYWLSLCIAVEAGSSWVSDEQQLLVGNVVLNRVASPLFSNSIYDVLHQAGQYPWVNRSVDNITVSDQAVANAKRLLEGERFCPENVVFQAEFRQGNGVYASFYDDHLGNTTYFCYI